MININGIKNNVGGDRRDYYKWIRITLEDFYQSYINGDRLKFYSFFDTDFQTKVPLNIFLYHTNYSNIKLDQFEDIMEIELSKLRNRATVKVLLRRKEDTVIHTVKLKKEFGKWKVLGEYFF